VKVGCKYTKENVFRFTLWAPFLSRVDLKVVKPREGVFPMERDDSGYWRAEVEGLEAGADYLLILDGGAERPDPASHFQPHGVHGPSRTVDQSLFRWSDSGWEGFPLSKAIMYELHVGTFTQGGTFDDVIPVLDELKGIGINAVEIMPVAQFPGKRNWGYDGAYLYAPQDSYGGPEGLKRLVNECHKRGMAVVLDVVYNHLGPEGNYLGEFGPYFTDRYRAPWGRAVNFDGPWSNEVRNFFIENALHWFENYHIDALRLDAVHGIFDFTARPFLLDLTERVDKFSEERGREFHLIVESDLNNPVVVRERKSWGWGFHGQWLDDFHHSVHTLLTGEDKGYYIDFGRGEDLVKSLREGFVFTGQYSRYRKRNHGSSSEEIPAKKFVVFCQNHDQVGNRLLGERLSSLVDFESLKLAAGVTILSPFIPLLFMGEEYGEQAPFLYFTSHTDPELAEAVRKGRAEELRAFEWRRELPDPQSEETFIRSRIDRTGTGERNRALKGFYTELIRLRKTNHVLSTLDKRTLHVYCMEEEKVVVMRRWREESQALCVFNFNTSDVRTNIAVPGGAWRKALDSMEIRWAGHGEVIPGELSPGQEINIGARSVALFVKE